MASCHDSSTQAATTPAASSAAATASSTAATTPSLFGGSGAAATTTTAPPSSGLFGVQAASKDDKSAKPAGSTPAFSFSVPSTTAPATYVISFLQSYVNDGSNGCQF